MMRGALKSMYHVGASSLPGELKRTGTLAMEILPPLTARGGMCIRSEGPEVLPLNTNVRWPAPQRILDLFDDHRGVVTAGRLAQRTRMRPHCLRGHGRVHASPNVTKKVLDWEYTVEILHSDLRARLRDQLHASPPRSALPHEGPIPQGPGALYGQSIPPSVSAAGGQDHV